MTLAAGTRFGQYEILAPLGAGGMGEVYRARDQRLGREVALKVLSGTMVASPEARLRFEREARAVATLSHPNILAIHDFDAAGAVPYAVMELLEGETLRERLAGGALPPRKLAEFALQMAHGLAAAHDRGIVHRDLKPENVFVTAGGHVKILDFGLAKVPPPVNAGDSDSPTTPMVTDANVIMGTASYMSPEQVRAGAVDHRADIFAFGAVLYEMATGRRAFRRDTAAETMAAILNDEPPEASTSGRTVSAGLERIIRHCLEKRPAERFQSARDLAFNLAALEQGSDASGVRAAPQRARLAGRAWIAAAALLAGAAASAALFLFMPSLRSRSAGAAEFRRVTFRTGTTFAARFAPDSRDIVFTAAWDGKPAEVFVTREGSTDLRAVGLAGLLQSVSPQGEMAIIDTVPYTGGSRPGTLFQAPLTGGARRDLSDGVEGADWAADGSLALVRRAADKATIEHPPGTQVYEVRGRIRGLRFSPDGKRLAFFTRSPGTDWKLMVLEEDGRANPVWEGAYAEDLAWTPDAKELWFTAVEAGGSRGVFAVTLGGRKRLLLASPGMLSLHDVGPGGRVLLSHHTWSGGIMYRGPGETTERELGWLDAPRLADLDPARKLLLFTAAREAGAGTGGVFIRNTDGSAAVRLGDGYAIDLSPDGKWVATFLNDGVTRTRMLLPTGSGTPRTLTSGKLTPRVEAVWLAGGTQIAFNGSEEGKGIRVWLQQIGDGSIRPISPEGFVLRPQSASPDGTLVVAGKGEGEFLIPVSGSPPRAIPGLDGSDAVLGWAGSDALYVTKAKPKQIAVDILELASGKRTPWKTIHPADPTAIDSAGPLVIARDGQSYAYSYERIYSNLYIVEGLE